MPTPIPVNPLFSGPGWATAPSVSLPDMPLTGAPQFAPVTGNPLGTLNLPGRGGPAGTFPGFVVPQQGSPLMATPESAYSGGVTGTEGGTQGTVQPLSSDSPFANIGSGLGGRALSFGAGLLGGPLAGGIASGLANASNMGPVNSTLGAYGMPGLSLPQTIGGILGLNSYGRGDLPTAFANAMASQNARGEPVPDYPTVFGPSYGPLGGFGAGDPWGGGPQIDGSGSFDIGGEPPPGDLGSFGGGWGW